MKIQQLINDKMNPATNQFVIFDGNKIYFQSYQTTIARYDVVTNELVLSKDWNYSRTTTKHLNIFLREYTNYYISSSKEIKENIKNKTFKIVNTF